MTDEQATLEDQASDTYTPPAEGDRKGFAVYNLTLGRYVGGVQATKPTKADAGKLVPEGHDVEVRPV
jgi:hypothetical protein